MYCNWSRQGESFTRSTDGGRTFTTFSGPDGAGLAWGTMSVAPDGTLFAAGSIGSGGRPSTIGISTNAEDPMQIPTLEFFEVELGGRTFIGRPNPDGILGQIWVATDHSDGSTHRNVYVLATVEQPLDYGGDVMFIRSTDGGATWSEPLRVNDDADDNGAYHWFGTMSVAPNGRIDAIWNDSRANPGLETANLNELYYSFSSDAGVTWSTNVPVSPIFDSHVGWPQQAKIGDYYDMISDNLGANLAWAATFNGEQDVYFLRIGPWDCNGNEVPDEEDIALATSLDCNANDVPDECEYRGDFDGDALATLADVAAFQQCFTGPDTTILDPCCRLFDLDESKTVDTADLPNLQRILSGP